MTPAQCVWTTYVGQADAYTLHADDTARSSTAVGSPYRQTIAQGAVYHQADVGR